MKITTDETGASELHPASVKIVIDKCEMREIYLAMAKAEIGDKIVLDGGLVIVVE